MAVVINGTTGIDTVQPLTQTVTATGKLGIGVTSPTGKVHIKNDSAIATNAQTAYDNASLRLDNLNTGSSVGLSFGLLGANTNYIQGGYNEGTVAPIALNPYGGGVAIGGTAAANTMDEYEEGTWVPAILSAGVACDATVSHVDGAYTKIGRLVTAMIRLRTTNKGTATGQMGITLPFAVADVLGSTGLEGSASVGNYAGVGVTHAKLSGAPIEGTSSMRFYYIATSNTNLVNQLTVAQLASIFDIRVTISYMT